MKALQFGMSYDDFWHGEAELFWAYQTAFLNKMVLDFDTANRVAWLQGLYIHKAVQVVLHNSFTEKDPQEYFDKPIDFDNFLEEEKQKRQQKLENQMKAFLANKKMIIEKKKES